MLFRTVRDELLQFHKERQEPLMGLLVALMSKSTVFFLGAPGTAKSLLVNDLCKRVDGSPKYFEWLLTKFSTPEELFGPISLTALENDHYTRVTTGKLPEANVVFIDEIFKASAGILNSLLTVLNERKFYNDGGATHVPWEILVGASNETPQDPSLSALYDRMLLRYVLPPIQSSAEFLSMVLETASHAPGDASIAAKELREARLLIPAVKVNQTVLDGMMEIRAKLLTAGLRPSDRRWKNALRMVQARAVLYERDAAVKEDLSILAHIMWDTAEQRRAVDRLVSEVANPMAAMALDYLDTISEIEHNTLYLEDGSLNPTLNPQLGAEANVKLKTLTSEINDLVREELAVGHDVSKLAHAADEAKAANRRVVEIALGEDLSAYRILKQAKPEGHDSIPA